MRFALVALLAACVDAPVEETASAPLVGVDGSTDAADRSCNVVLRGLERDGSVNGSTWVWTGTVEISEEAAAEGLVPTVIYGWAQGSQPWNVATVAPVSGATPGFARFSVRIDHDVPGPGMSPIADWQVEPFLRLSGGGRLFDHNRNGSDFANYVVTAPDMAIWGAPSTCGAPLTGQRAKLVFASDFTQHREGVLAPGGSVEVDYDTARLAGCRWVQGGHDFWSITAHLKFDAGEELALNVTDGPATATVPSDVRSVQVWFESVNVSGCHQFDSNFGNNYAFDVAHAPQWIGLATNLITRDSSDPCDGGSPASSGFSFDTWARQRAVRTNLCFQVYQPGVTDTDVNPWQSLDAEIHYSFDGKTWVTSPVSFESRQGNNSRYLWTWRNVDPFRDFHCPEAASTPTTDGMYQQIPVQYFITVNGGELRPEPGAAFGGSFIDYPTNPWRTGNCE